MRWLFHIVTKAAWGAFHRAPEQDYAPASLATEGFVHASYRDEVAESARLYFRAFAPEDLLVLRIDPRALSARVEEAATPRGHMPHIHGAIPRAAICAVFAVADIGREPDAIAGGGASPDRGL